MNTTTTEATAAAIAIERKLRLAAELARFEDVALDAPCYDLPEAEEMLHDLASEAGYSSAKFFLSDTGMWSAALREAVEWLVNSVFALDGKLYGSHGALAAAAGQGPEDFVDPDELKPESVRIRFLRDEPGEYLVEIHPEDEPFTTPGSVERAIGSLLFCRSMLRTAWMSRLYMRHVPEFRAPRGWRKIKDLQAEFAALPAAVKARQMPTAGTGRSKPRPRTNKTRRKK